MKNTGRNQLYVVPTVQWRLLVRVIAYWGSCFLFITIPVLLVRVFADPSRLFYEHIPDLWRQSSHMALPLVLILPLALVDMLRYSNRLVGPIYRLRREMTKLAEGHDVRHLKFRDNDEWQELAEVFNRVIDEVRESRRLKSPCAEVVTDVERGDLELSQH